MFVSVIVPAYKQKRTIVKDIESIHDAMSKTRWEFEILVVVDGNSDGTLEEAKSISKKNVIAIGYETNRGKGYAVRYGMARAKGDVIAFIDSGMDINPNGISMILEHMEWYNADIVVGSKKHPVSKVNYPPIRRLYSFGYFLLVWILFDLKLRDTQSGLKVYRREVLEKVLPRLVIKKFAFDIEMLAVARHLGFTRIYEAPIEVNWDKINTSFDSLLILNPHILRMLVDTAGIFYRLRLLKYYDDENKRKWVFDEELDMRVNTGEYEAR